MKISIIATVSENNVIDDKLIRYLSNDLKHFRMHTTESTVIMGRKTYKSLGKPLPNRRNIVLTRQPDYPAEGCIVVHSEEEALQEAGSEEVFIIGGSEVYRNFWNRADNLYLTRIHTDVIGDTYIPPIRSDVWIEESREFHWADEKNSGYNYSFINYGKKRLKDSISIVLSTYNQSEWLEKTLYGYEAQTFKNFELILADDGSRKETYDKVQALIPQLSFPVKHVWHEDKGFRKCEILNKSILASASDYLLFSDGDCIPRNDFVAVHFLHRKTGHFLSNGYHKLNMELSRLITKDDIFQGHCFTVKWLKAHGISASFKNNKFTTSNFKAWLLNTFTPTKATWNGHGASGWIFDILKTNGFNEQMKYGGQDREFGERLENNGIHGIQIRYSTVCIHLDHPREYKTFESIVKNKAIRKYTRKTKVLRTPNGID
ncbi:Dihydrofolate reductase [termite gut metagenome]|uniref:Dihydrofolate reductase n=1 Tax=termite gut metagenome TaxID=433724 RepID=A0A5J4QS50_9ZZZZ